MEPLVYFDIIYRYLRVKYISEYSWVIRRYSDPENHNSFVWWESATVRSLNSKSIFKSEKEKENLKYIVKTLAKYEEYYDYWCYIEQCNIYGDMRHFYYVTPDCYKSILLDINNEKSLIINQIIKITYNLFYTPISIIKKQNSILSEYNGQQNMQDFNPKEKITLNIRPIIKPISFEINEGFIYIATKDSWQYKDKYIIGSISSYDFNNINSIDYTKLGRSYDENLYLIYVFKTLDMIGLEKMLREKLYNYTEQTTQLKILHANHCYIISSELLISIVYKTCSEFEKSIKEKMVSVDYWIPS